MRWPVSALLILAAAGPAAVTLSEEGSEVLERLMAQGYSGTGFVVLEVDLLQPCSLDLYPPLECGGGFYLALGGNNILDLGLSLYGEYWILSDSMPDDYPVIRVDSMYAAQGDMLVVEALDMIRGATSDSVVVIWAFAPVR